MTDRMVSHRRLRRSLPRAVLNSFQDPARRAAVLELVLVGAWTLWVCRPYLDFDPNVLPGGREYSSAIQTHHIWSWLKECGWCALWNGAERGGYPAFADLHGSALHPLVAVATLLFGAVNGSKIVLVTAFWLGGVACWWMARLMKVGRLPRLWAGLMGVVGGHLAARMELGAFGVVLSVAACSLVFPAAVSLARTGSRRDSIVLGVVLASAILAGQGYIQFGLVCTAPAFLLLLVEDSRLRPIWREYGMALGLGLLLAAPFLVPLGHFLPDFAKAGDPSFGIAQPLEYIPLNLVIRDREFLTSSVLSKSPFPHLDATYIGWVPVVLAVLCLKVARCRDRRLLLFFGAWAALSFLAAAAVPLRWIEHLVPALAWVRNPPQIAALAVPAILSLSAYGLERLLEADWPGLTIDYDRSSSQEGLTVSLRWVLIIPLVWNLFAAYDFARIWLYSTELRDDVEAVLQALRTPSLQWVEPPFGEHYWIEPAVRMGLKLSPGVMTWQIRDRPFPKPYMEASRLGPPPEGKLVEEVEGVPIYRFEDREYAFVAAGGESLPCQASGTGGDLTVACTNPSDGRLVIRENRWPGWFAWRDGERVRLLEGQWLSVAAPAGAHHYRFRYLPWDVPLGVLLSFLGVGLSIWQWTRPGPCRTTAGEEAE